MALDARALILAGVGLVGLAGVVVWVVEAQRGPSVEGTAPVPAEPAAPEVPPAPGGARPNVLVVLWDTVRADRMSVYGYERPTTPHLEALAAEAVVYDQAISPGMWTVPAHGSLFTGLTAASHGAKVGWLWLDDHHVTLAEHFGEHGYATWAWSSNPYLSEATNLLQGFETVELSWSGEWSAAAARATRSKLIEADRSVEISPSWDPQHGQGWPEHLTAYKDGAPVAVEALLAWVDERPADAPWLAYVNLLEAHHPRVPSLEARQAVLTPDLLQAGLDTDGSLFRVMAVMEGREELTEPELDALGGVYDATLLDLDRATGALIEGLRSRGSLDDTVVVVVSDHGEHLGEHELHDHRWSLYQPLVHVPLIVRAPGVAPGRVSTPVSTAHLFGSLLGWTGVPAPAVAHALPALGSEPRAFTELVAPTPRLAEIRSAFPDLAPERWRLRYQAVLEDGWKFWRVSNGRHRLFDLTRDPGETRNLITTDEKRGRAMWTTVKTWDEERPAYDRSLRRPTDSPGNPLELDESLREQLKLLGYTEDGEEAP